MIFYFWAKTWNSFMHANIIDTKLVSLLVYLTGVEGEKMSYLV